MKLIIRADDVGYTDFCNIGTFETMEHGVVTAADVMFDTPGAVNALERLRALPWISVGWHAHFWGKPVLGGDKVPTMFDRKRDRFRTDLSTSQDVSFEEALAECRAEIELCIRILGRAPDVGSFGGGFGKIDSPMIRAMIQVEDEYGIAHDVITQEILPGNGTIPFPTVDPRWKERRIYCSALESMKALETDSLTEILNYDPIRYFLEDKGGMLSAPEDCVVMSPWHPGYVDYYVYRLGDFSEGAKRVITSRTVDVHALTSQEVKDWIKQNRIELVNFRDALYGTREYQNHLRASGSELYLAKM